MSGAVNPAGFPIDSISPYGYLPSVSRAAVFIAFFTASAVLHSWQAYKWKGGRWIIVMAIGSVCEAVGWGFRIWSNNSIQAIDSVENLTLDGGYQGQTVLLILGPTFYSAALYMLLGTLIARVNPRASWLSARVFKIAFIVADVVSIVLQAIGGGLAATASDENPSQGRLGSDIMLGGIIFQLIVMVVYTLYLSLWAYKSRQEMKIFANGIYWLLLGIDLCSLAIMVRGVYRSAELAQGFSGAIAKNSQLFLLDGIPVILATWAINIFHPCWFFQNVKAEGTNAARTCDTAETRIEMKPSKRGEQSIQAV